MEILDYIIAQQGLEWSKILGDWKWILPSEFELWIVNRFADLIIVQPDGSVWMLDTSGGLLNRIADSKRRFSKLAKDPDNFGYWFMGAAVDELVAAGEILEFGQCYSYKLPPALGGQYEIANYIVTDLRLHLGLHAQILSQIKDLPDGTKISISISPQSES